MTNIIQCRSLAIIALQHIVVFTNMIHCNVYSNTCWAFLKTNENETESSHNETYICILKGAALCNDGGNCGCDHGSLVELQLGLPADAISLARLSDLSVLDQVGLQISVTTPREVENPTSPTVSSALKRSALRPKAHASMVPARHQGTKQSSAQVNLFRRQR